MHIELTPEILLAAYTQGIFPMADSADSDDVHWLCPEMRGQLSIENLHIPKRLKKSLRQMKIADGLYSIRVDTDFEGVMRACAAPQEGRGETWINEEIVSAYVQLYEKGYAHSVECWLGEKMVGGLYGIAIGGAFFGESMFSTARDASKVALVHLVARLHHAGFEVLDTQFVNPHLEQFGVYEIPHAEYVERLAGVLLKKCDFKCDGVSERTLIKAYFEQKANRGG